MFELFNKINYQFSTHYYNNMFKTNNFSSTNIPIKEIIIPYTNVRINIITVSNLNCLNDKIWQRNLK